MAREALQSRTVAIAGAGIAGLACAIAVARAGFRAIVLERAAAVSEVGAGLQLSPNAARSLARLGLLERVAAVAVAPEAMSIRAAGSGREIVRVPLGAAVTRRFGRPWLVAHRADLHAALMAAARELPDIDIRFATTVDDWALHPRGATLVAARGGDATEETVIALVGADGLWSAVRKRAGDTRPPLYRDRTAWRATVAAEKMPAALREPWSGLWLGADAHLVHYPIRGGRDVNIVAVVRDTFREETWSGSGNRADLLARFRRWSDPALDLLSAADRWLKWPLADRAPLGRWGDGAQTLIGDAAHPMLPFLAQGAAMALEDAVVLGRELAKSPREAAPALRAYERLRRPRTAAVQAAARSNGRLYHLAGPAAAARDLALRTLGGEHLLERYRWLFGWRPD